MNNLFYTPEQLEVFSNYLRDTFINSGFEIVEEPYVDYALYGFRATYVRRYLLHKPTKFHDGILTTLIHVVALPFGHQSHKMVIISAPKSLNQEPVSDTIKIRVHFDEGNSPYIMHGDQHYNGSPHQSHNDQSSASTAKPPASESQDNYELYQSFMRSYRPDNTNHSYTKIHKQFLDDLSKYVAQIIEVISPGLIGLPQEMKLEILKKLSISSIIKMSQVNNEFKKLIFEQGESLWRHLCLRDFNIRTINRLVHRSWMELYRDTYVVHQIEICRKERALPGLPERPALPPAPHLLQIGWLPEFMDAQLYPPVVVAAIPALPPVEPVLNLALELYPLRRAGSLDSLNGQI